MARKKRNKSNKIANLTGSILNILKKEPKKSFNYRQIAAKLKVEDPSSRNQIIKKLAKLKADKEIKEVTKGTYSINRSVEVYEGKLDINSSGNGYVIVEGLEQDIFVSNKNLNRALYNDTVEVEVYHSKRSRRPEGVISKVIERNKTEFVGVLQLQKSFGFMVASPSSKMHVDIFIPKNKLGDEAKNGEVVLVEMLDWPEHADSPFGTIKKVLGQPGDHQTEIHSILADYGLPYEFPYDVQHYADQLDTSITDEEIAKRRDMRDTLTFTIDPKDAKDFDDALSFKVLENKNYEIGVHIADVSHYLQEGTILDAEAYDRATSVYLVDRVVPMLPEILSNGACSLRPHEEKYTFSAVFEIDKNAKVVHEWFGRTVTYSDARFAYEEAQSIIETESNTIPSEVSLTGAAYEVDDAIVESVLTFNRLAKIMRSKRMQAGAISFDKVEVKFNLDEEANPIGVFFKTSKDANKLIEEFMLLANRSVAAFIGKQKPEKTFIYRVHDEPDEEKLMQLQGIISRFGHSLNLKTRKDTTASLNKLLSDVKGQKEQNLVDTLAVRSMSKAEYATQNIGHYGLAFDYYSHFTSPIRRYPDVMVHRLLQHYLEGGKTPEQGIFDEKCQHCSTMENLSAKAERDSIKYMQIKFMQDHKDEEFEGVISGVTEWGIYVEITSNKCEGMVRTKDLTDDIYEFVAKEYAMVGKSSGNVYQLGDEVIVKVKNTDLVKRHLDFKLLGRKAK